MTRATQAGLMIEALLLGSIILLGPFTQRFTGVGCAMVVSPLLVLLLGPVQGVVVTVSFGLAVSAVIALLHLRDTEHRKVLPMLVAAAIGIVLAAVPDVSGWNAVGGALGIVGGVLLARAARKRVSIAGSRALIMGRP